MNTVKTEEEKINLKKKKNAIDMKKARALGFWPEPGKKLRNSQREIKMGIVNVAKRKKLLPPLSQNELDDLEVEWASETNFIKRWKIIIKFFKHCAVAQLRFTAAYDSHPFLRALSENCLKDLAKF